MLERLIDLIVKLYDYKSTHTCSMMNVHTILNMQVQSYEVCINFGVNTAMWGVACVWHPLPSLVDLTLTLS